MSKFAGSWQQADPEIAYTHQDTVESRPVGVHNSDLVGFSLRLISVLHMLVGLMFATLFDSLHAALLSLMSKPSFCFADDKVTSLESVSSTPQQYHYTISVSVLVLWCM